MMRSAVLGLVTGGVLVGAACGTEGGREDEGNGPGALSYLPVEGEQTFPVFPAERR